MLNSEPIFADYLTENRFNWKYELPIGLSKPDFSVWQDEATPYAFWDVADREPSAQEEAEVDALIRRLREGTEPATEVQGGPSKGYYFVRSKIRSKYSQFKKAAPIPGMLVLAEWTGRASLDPDMMAAAIYGWPQVIVSPGHPHREPSFARANDGKMVDESVADQNRHVSAIGILNYRQVNYYKHGLNQFTKDVNDRFDDFRHCLDLISQQERRQRSQGLDLDLKAPTLDIFLTLDAHNPWPQELAGTYDRIYEFDPRTHHFALVRDGLAPIVRIPVPASLDQQDIWSVEGLPGLRNE